MLQETCCFNQWKFYVIWCILLLQFVHCEEDGITKCVNQKLKKDFDLPLDIVNDNGELELWIQFNGKYDFYQTYNTGQIYNYELQLNEKITPRSPADKANCSNYLLPKASWYQCPYTIMENEHGFDIALESFLRRVTYSIDKKTKEVTYMKDSTGLYGPTQEESQLECVHQIPEYSFPLPIEVNRKYNHLEVTVKYQGKYDFYNTISLGTICGIQYQLDEKPNPTVEDYAHCSKCGNAAELYFWCPFRIDEDENDIIISLKAFFYNNVYTINKLTKEMNYTKMLIGSDPKKDYEEDIKKCENGLSVTNVSLPVQIIRNDNFLEIWVKYNGKYDIFETYVSGSVCKHDIQSTRDPSILVPRAAAECFSPGLDVPYYFLCPYGILEDDEYVFFKVYTSDQYLYALNKSSGELIFRRFGTLYDSTHQSTLTYLRSIVMDPNFF